MARVPSEDALSTTNKEDGTVDSSSDRRHAGIVSTQLWVTMMVATDALMRIAVDG